jgi:hypothetical protein
MFECYYAVTFLTPWKTVVDILRSSATLRLTRYHYRSVASCSVQPDIALCHPVEAPIRGSAKARPSVQFLIVAAFWPAMDLIFNTVAFGSVLVKEIMYDDKPELMDTESSAAILGIALRNTLLRILSIDPTLSWLRTRIDCGNDPYCCTLTEGRGNAMVGIAHSIRWLHLW